MTALEKHMYALIRRYHDDIRGCEDEAETIRFNNDIRDLIEAVEAKKNIETLQKLDMQRDAAMLRIAKADARTRTRQMRLRRDGKG